MGRGSLRYYLIVCCLILNSVAARADETKTDCKSEVAFSESPAVQASIDEITAACPSPASCSLPRLKEKIAQASERHPHWVLEWLKNVPGRVAVLALWVGSVGGAAYLARLAGGWLVEPFPTIATALGALLGNDLFGRVLTPVKDQYGPVIDRIGCRLWNPGGRWGRLMTNTTEDNRFAAQEVCRLLILIRPYLDGAAAALKKGDTDQAAELYLMALMNAIDLQSWFNLDEATVVRDVKLTLIKEGPFSSEVLVETLRLAKDKAAAVGPVEMPRTREPLPSAVDRILRVWLSL